MGGLREGRPPQGEKLALKCSLRGGCGMKGICIDKEVETSGQIVESEVEKF